jgi:hypothetical protein
LIWWKLKEEEERRGENVIGIVTECWGVKDEVKKGEGGGVDRGTRRGRVSTGGK